MADILTKTIKGVFGVGEKQPPQKEFSKPVGEKKVLLAWESLSRPYKANSETNKLNRTFTVIGIVLAFILIILQDFLLLLVIGSFIFVSYVLGKIPPENIKYTVTTHGITVGDTAYEWDELQQYFFKELDGSHVLVIDLMRGTAPRLFVTYLPQDRDKIHSILVEHLLYLDSEPKSFIDKTYESVMGKFNIK